VDLGRRCSSKENVSAYKDSYRFDLQKRKEPAGRLTLFCFKHIKEAYDMSICIIQEREFPNFKTTLWAATVQLKRIPNAEFGVRNGPGCQVGVIETEIEIGQSSGK
jgi:hypothetical protein